jgi:hypothetical protein
MPSKSDGAADRCAPWGLRVDFTSCDAVGNDREVRTASRAQVRQPIHARGLSRWRAFATQLTPLTAELEAAGMLVGWDSTFPDRPTLGQTSAR